MRCSPYILATAAVCLLVTAPCAGSQPEPTRGTSNAVQALAFDLASHPEVEAADLYKFLHQANFGPGHAITDTTQAAEALQSEIAGLGPPGLGEAWCDTLGGDPLLVRVNLRPFVANGFDTGALLESLEATADAVHSDPRQMGVALELVVRWLSSEEKKDLAQALQNLGRKMGREGYPAVHHSAAYQQAYHPAYRVVDASMASSQGWCGSTF